MKILSLLTRAAIGAPFVFLGYDAVKEPGMRVKMATDFGVPEEYGELAVRANGAAMVLGGLSVITGLLPRLGAAAVVASMIPTTLAGHSFWNDTDPKQRKTNTIQFLKNVGMVGGLLAVAAAPKPSKD
ncbi:DoxX family protein [Tessaracoccus sp. OS52]|uniref:DoxX family protein n=1 Tax=Tessaracoccus sp. OS52 TaxID=2886691 RepID=UPI001D0F75E8|nr:DoxX family protein [Tessaracoccus sp. OS52]MCC2594510.1 DoxX family protein [Tessaracoccus sp. OS52]